MPVRSRLLGAAVLSGAAVLAVSACSSSGSSSSSTASGPAAATSSTGSSASGTTTGSTATGSVIKIGYMVSLSGPEASSTVAALPTALAWEKYTNAHGGIDGHQVDIVSADSQGTATGGQAAISTLVQQDKVDAVILSDPIAEYAVEPGLAKDNIAVLDGQGHAEFWWQTPNFFENTLSGDVEVASSVPAGKAAGATELAVAVCSENAACAGDANAIFPTQTKADGIKYAGYVQVASTATDFTAQCLAFKQRNANYIYLDIAPAGGAHLMANCIQQGYSGMFGATGGSFDISQFRSITGLKMVGTINGFPWWSTAPAVQAFRTAMSTYEPTTDYETSQATSTWTSLDLLAKGVENTKPSTISTATILAAMYSIKNETLGGLLPQPVTYTTGKASPKITCFWQFKYDGGQANPTLLPPTGKSGNGASGQLASACLS